MAHPSSDLTMPPLLAITVVLAVIALTTFVVRALERRARLGGNRQRVALADSVRRFLDGSLPATQLFRATERLGEGTCWTVLEALSLRLTRREWLSLSGALARSRHAAAERRAMVSDSPWRRVLAARRLGLLRSRASWRALRRAMVRGPAMVTHAAAIALARYRDRGALRWILAHQETLASRHRNALVALLKAFGRSGLPVVAEALARGGSLPRFGLAMIDALGAARYRPARPCFERFLAEGGLDQRIAAARALGLAGDAGCATALLVALEDEAWQVRAQAARALGRLRAAPASEALAHGLTDPSWWVRRHAAYALAELGDHGQAALRLILASSADRYARDMAREALDGEFARRAG